MAWVEIPNTDIDVDSYGREDTVFQRLRNNLRELRRALFAWVFAEATTGSTTFVALAGTTIDVFVPNLASYSGLTRKFKVQIQGKASSTHTSTYRIRDTASGNTSAVEPTTTSTSYAEITIELAIDAGWLGTVRTLEIQAKTSAGGGTAYAQSVNRVTGEVFY